MYMYKFLFFWGGEVGGYPLLASPSLPREEKLGLKISFIYSSTT